MPASIGVNLRVTGHCRQGGRKYMEDFFAVAYQQTEDEKDLEYAFFGIFDGHGGAEAAAYAKEHLMETIVRHKNFWSDNDEDVLRAIKDGYIATHYAMWKEQEKWPKTATGLPSTAGTTASIAFIRRGKIYLGHVGDSGIILGYQEPGCSEWKAKPLTKDHKPENAVEMMRITQCGGKVISKSGVPRVVWNRPRIGHQGPVRRSTPIDEIPFLAVARSLGDLWSYNSQLDEFVVSPDPDCSVIPIDTNTFRCLIFGTDGLYNMLSPQMAVHIVQQAERHNEQAALGDSMNNGWLNPSRCLVDKALERWSTTKMRADNTSVVTLMLDPPGPPRAQVLRNKKKNGYPNSGLQIMTRYADAENENPNNANKRTPTEESKKDEPSSDVPKIPENVQPSQTNVDQPDIDKDFVPRGRESTSYDPRDKTSTSNTSLYEKSPVKTKPNEKNLECGEADSNEAKTARMNEESIQINEISSSSSDDVDVTEYENVETPTKREESDRINLRSRGKQDTSEERKKRLATESLEKIVKKLRPEEINTSSRSLRERKQPTLEKKEPEQVMVNKSISIRKRKLLRRVLSPRRMKFALKPMSSRQFLQKTMIRKKTSNLNTKVKKIVQKVAPKKEDRDVKVEVNDRRKNSNISSQSPGRNNGSTLGEKRELRSPRKAEQAVTKKEPSKVPETVQPKSSGRSRSSSTTVLKQGCHLRSGLNLNQYNKNLRLRRQKKK